MLTEILKFLKNPIYQVQSELGTNEKIKYTFKLAVLAVFFSVALSFFIGGLQTIFGLEFGEHALDDFLENYPVIYLLFFAIIVAPFLEELIFRGPMIWFCEYKTFPYFFYALTLAFGFMHITNYEMNIQNLLLSPILVAPQLSAGLLLGFARVKFGLMYAMLLHAIYNSILAGPVILLQMIDIPLE